MSAKLILEIPITFHFLDQITSVNLRLPCCPLGITSYKGETTNLINSMHQKDTIHDAVIDLNNEAVEAKIQFYKVRIMAGLSTMDRLRSQREAAASGGQAGAAGGQAPV